MLRKTVSFTLIAIGMLMLGAGLGGLVPAGSTYAQSVPQPTPRPPLPPEESGKHSSAIVAMGHITGTVIDKQSGAPMPGAQVRVGEATVTTDPNGNYDLWTAVGSYVVGFVGADGTVAETYTVDIIADQPTIRHLVGAQVTLVAPTAIPTAVVAAAVAPTAQPAATAVPNSAALVPNRLPHTAGNPVTLFGGWFWVSLGIALLAGGLLIGARADSLRVPAAALANYALSSPSAAADAAALLAALLTTESRAATTHEDALLQTLLVADACRRRAAQEVLAELLSQPMQI